MMLLLKFLHAGKIQLNKSFYTTEMYDRLFTIRFEAMDLRCCYYHFITVDPNVVERITLSYPLVQRADGGCNSRSLTKLSLRCLFFFQGCLIALYPHFLDHKLTSIHTYTHISVSFSSSAGVIRLHRQIVQSVMRE